MKSLADPMVTIDKSLRPLALARRPRPPRPLVMRLGPALIVPALAFMLAFYIVPVARLVELSLHATDASATPLAAYQSILASRRFLLSLERTMRISALSTVMSLLIAFPISLYLVGVSRRVRTIILTITFVSLSASLIVRNYGWLVVLGDSGPINNLLLALGLITAPLRMVYSEGATALALLHYCLPFMILPIYGALVRIKPSQWEAAQALGASPWTCIRTVILPLAMPGIYGGSTLVFAIASSVFVTPIMLGAPSTAFVSQLAADEFLVQLDFSRGAAIVVVLTATTFIALAGYALAIRCVGRIHV